MIVGTNLGEFGKSLQPPKRFLINLRESWGLAAIALGCKQLTKLDIKKCHNIDDSGMIPVAHFSQNLRQINLSYTSVTNVGFLSLASVSCTEHEHFVPKGIDS